jgi:hypothetical protein
MEKIKMSMHKPLHHKKIISLIAEQEDIEE